ncbi:MAG: cisplatin damage response ATP-dependent DNA ligase, partial [Gammaproteobacteria bacterium]|nr:cisplatin damage response ATP-dependent DNA ligase [Gammaproteobacteria bacterium]
MRAFVELIAQIDRARGTNDKVQCLVAYFSSAPAADAAWAVYFLSGRRIKRLLGPAQLKAWLAQASSLPLWLIDETHAHVGDLAETVALLLDPNPNDSQALQQGLSEWVDSRVIGLRDLEETDRQQAVVSAWQALDAWSRFVYTKLLTGALRIGVSQTLVERALAETTGQPRAVIAHRLMGQWEPTSGFFSGLFEARSAEEMASQPYPFFLAHPIKADPASELNAINDWQIEWKWDGIRAQLLCRGGAQHLWSRGEQMIDTAFPELLEAAKQLPLGTVVDGEILAWNNGVLPFSVLQRRLGRKQVSAKLRAEAPVQFLIYDLLEHRGQDLRSRPLSERRAQLEALLKDCCPPLALSPLASAPSWEALHALRDESRSRGVEGLMLKRKDSEYGTGRPRGSWWKWKVDPLT